MVEPWVSLPQENVNGETSWVFSLVFFGFPIWPSCSKRKREIYRFETLSREELLPVFLFFSKRSLPVSAVFRPDFKHRLAVFFRFNLRRLVASKRTYSAYLYADSGFMAYSSGVYTHTCDHWANHAITVVGFGPDYWSCLNSWGTYWGVQGTFKVGLCVLTDFQCLG